jgi:hypothetical protein
MFSTLRASLSKKFTILKIPTVTLALALMSSFGFASITTAQGLPVAVSNSCKTALVQTTQSPVALSVSTAPAKSINL